MLPAVVGRSNGSVLAVAEGRALTFDLADYRWRAEPRDGQPVKIGFRPEHFVQPGDEVAGKALRIDLPVQFIEKSGPDAIAFLGLAGGNIAVRVEPHAAARYRQGETAAVLLPLHVLNVFDAETGRRM